MEDDLMNIFFPQSFSLNSEITHNYFKEMNPQQEQLNWSYIRLIKRLSYTIFRINYIDTFINAALQLRMILNLQSNVGSSVIQIQQRFILSLVHLREDILYVLL